MHSTLRLSTGAILALTSLAWNEASSAPWLPATMSLDRASVYEAALAPSEPDQIFAITVGWGLYRSEDQGDSWTDLTQNLPADRVLEAIAISPNDPNFLLLGGERPTTDTVLLLRSIDGGDSWSETSTGIEGRRVTALAFHPLDPSVVYAGTGWADPSGVYRSEDAGSTWTLTTAALGDVRIHALVIDPFDPAVLLGATASGYIRSTDGGANWTFHATAETFSSISASAATPNLFYATSSTGLYKSTDGGAAFSPIPAPSGFLFDPIVADPSSGAVVFLGGQDFCGTWDGGTLWRSTNGGSSWVEIFQPPDCGESIRAILLDSSRPNRLLLATQGKAGVFRSTNGGVNWTIQNAGIHSFGVRHLRSDGAGTLYGRSGDFVSLAAPAPDGPWTELPPPFYAEIYAFEPSPGASGLLYECGIGSPSDVFWPYMSVSTNGGASWQPPLGDLPDGLDPTPLLVAPAWDDHTAYVFGAIGLYKTEDANQTYTRTGDAIVVEAAAVDPTDAARIFAARRYDPVVILTTDGGATWDPRAGGLPQKPCVYLEIDPADPLHLLVVFSSSGAWETTDGGESWEQTLPFAGVIRNADWNPLTGNVYLCTNGSGIVTNDARATDQGAITLSPLAVIYVDGADALVMSTGNGLYYQRLSDPAAVEDAHFDSARLQLRISPNPAIGHVGIEFSTAARSLEGAQILLGIHDVRGRLVRAFEGNAHGSAPQWTWDARDAQGRMVPAGMYFVRARVTHASQSWRATQTVIVTR